MFKNVGLEKAPIILSMSGGTKLFNLERQQMPITSVQKGDLKTLETRKKQTSCEKKGVK